MKRALLVLLLAALALPTLVVGIFYGYENWTGGAAWRRVEATLQAAGEPLSLDAFRPDPLPDAQNMAAAPVFREIFTFSNPRRASLYGLQLPPTKLASPGDQLALIALARRFQPDFNGDATAAAQVVLTGIAPFEPLLDAVRLAAARPGNAWPARTTDITTPAPILSPLKRTSEVLAARAIAAVAGRQSASALADFHLITQLARRSNQPPSLAGCYAGQLMLGYAIQIVGDGLAQGAWSDEDLAAIEAALGQFHPLADFRDGVRGERALFLTAPEALKTRAAAIFTIIDFRSPAAEWFTTALCRVIWLLRPSGWEARDRASYASFAQDWVGGVIHNGFVRPWALAEWNARLSAVRRSPMEFFRTPITVLVLPTFANAARSAAYAQARLDFARLACAIERQRRAEGRIPASLDALSPQWIDTVPRDVVGGGRYIYRPAESGSYVLYGKGWNARDDGGRGDNGNALLGPSTADDWVWTSLRPAP
jgi:hypothetical protein